MSSTADLSQYEWNEWDAFLTQCREAQSDLGRGRSYLELEVSLLLRNSSAGLDLLSEIPSDRYCQALGANAAQKIARASAKSQSLLVALARTIGRDCTAGTSYCSSGAVAADAVRLAFVVLRCGFASLLRYRFSRPRLTLTGLVHPGFRRLVADMASDTCSVSSSDSIVWVFKEYVPVVCGYLHAQVDVVPSSFGLDGPPPTASALSLVDTLSEEMRQRSPLSFCDVSYESRRRLIN